MADSLVITGRVLYLTRDPELLQRQLRGEDLPEAVADDPGLELLDHVSTDEIAPAWACYYYDRTLGRYVFAGLRGGVIGPDAIQGGGFQVVVSGRSKGCGSSREAAPYAEQVAGITLVVARSFERIYQQNCQNIGLLTTTDFGVLQRIRRREPLLRAEFTTGLDAISREVVAQGGLFAFSERRWSGGVQPELPRRSPRPLTLVEKIIAEHVVTEPAQGEVGVAAVAPGDAVFVKADVRFSHEYVTAMSEALFRSGFGPAARIRQPESVFAFRDHLTLLGEVMPDAHRRLGLLDQAERLAAEQRRFAAEQGITLFGEVAREGRGRGSEAICHNKVIESLAWPGQVVVGTDSHTCMAGVLGCFAFGIGSTEMANAWYTGDVRVRVPETVRLVFRGKLRPDACAKDVMLQLLATEFIRQGGALGKVLELSGPGLAHLDLDERATLTNMAVEAGAFTAIAPVDELVLEHLERRGASRPETRIIRPDPDAEYAATVTIDLDDVEPMVALPGDPKNGVPVAELERQRGVVPVHIAYGGSCTGGKRSDMDMYAAVLGWALSQGHRVAPGVQFFVQFGSQLIRDYAESRGYLEIFRRAGVQLVEPSCGACIRAGPGISSAADQVTISAINRNFPGRSGPGQVYLASPLVVAASAIAGRITAPPHLRAL